MSLSQHLSLVLSILSRRRWRVVEERKPAVKIREGTLERLVQTQLMAFRDNKLAYTIIFLSTYRAFASTHTVLQLLLDKYVWYWAGGPWWLECIAGADNSWSWWDLVSAGFCPSHSAITPGSIINMILMKSRLSVELQQCVQTVALLKHG